MDNGVICSGRRSSETKAAWRASIFWRSFIRCIVFKMSSKSPRTSQECWSALAARPICSNFARRAKREANSKVVQMALKPESKGSKGKGHSKQKRARPGQLSLFAPASETSEARNPMKKLVAGGGFEPPTFGL